MALSYLTFSQFPVFIFYSSNRLQYNIRSYGKSYAFSCKLMASSCERSVLRNPLKEDDTDIDTLFQLGPVRPEGGPFKGMSILVGDCLKTLKFQEGSFSGRPWLEYSIKEDAASCFYCRLFKPKVNGM